MMKKLLSPLGTLLGGLFLVAICVVDHISTKRRNASGANHVID